MANPILEAFQWGTGGAKLTPEQVARQREIAASLMQKGDPAFHNAGWLGAIGRGLEGAYSGWSEGRANRAETEGRADFNSRLSSILGGGALAAPELGGSPATSTAMATAPAPDYASARVAQAHNAGGAAVPTGERAEYIRQGLLNRGLPGHVADAFLMNFQDESGLNPGINEVAPIVPGSRGGYGLYQLTGPRRREYEAFAAERGSPLDDIDAQLDFLMREGSGSERAAFERILAAPDTGTAASEIVNRFLRPAQAHRESRAARYSRAPNTAVAANEAMAAGSLAGVPVAETPQDILAQESAMAAQDPMAFQQPVAPLAEPRMVSDMPVADIAQSLTGATVNPDMPNAAGPGGMGQGSPGEKRRGPDGQMYQYVETSGMAGASGGWGWIPVADDGSQGDLSGIAQALTANQVNPDLPMAGNTSGFLPVAQSLAAQPRQQGGMPNMQQLIELGSHPYANDTQRGIIQALLQQQMQAQDPYKQAQLEKLRLETEAMRNPTQKPIEVGGVLLDPSNMQPIFDSRDNTPSNVREYEYYANAETAAGRQPMPFGDWDQSRRRSGATNVTTNVGGENLTPGQKKIDEAFADTYLQWQSGGYADSAKQLDQLNESLGIIEKAAREGQNISGLIGTLPNAIQPFINPEGTVAREGVEEVVQRSLREILGAQFTEKEGERLIARAYNPALPPQENAKRVKRLLGQVQGMAESRQEMVDYFDENGTLRGYKGRRPALSQLENIESEWEREDNSAGRNDVSDKAPNGVDPEVWKFMTPEEKALFQ